MLILLFFSFLAGIVTILSPCILPLLPIILSATVENGTKNRRKPLGIVSGFILSFTFFTLFLSTLVKQTNLSAEVLRIVSVIIIASFGVSLLIPQVQAYTEVLFSKLSSKLSTQNTQNKHGLIGGLLVGFSLGLLWTPCVGPILASVISLALIGEVSSAAVFITLAYAVGTAIPMFAIMLGGRNLLNKMPGLTSNLDKIQKVFGVLMIGIALAIVTNIDRRFQTYILNTFPGYGAGLTQLEDNNFIQNELNKLQSTGDTTKQRTLPNDSNKVKAPELVQGGEWFNSEPLKLSELRGKVVLIDFWTYSCINCQRTLPYLRSWWKKYEQDGLVIIGVHAPEFEFEKEPANVQQAIEDFDLKYPVMQDNDFRTWRNYSNRYWPAKYLIDKEGNIVYWHFGEGAYDETEAKIQELLEVDYDISNETYENYSKTPETYLGYARIEGLVSPEDVAFDQTQTYSLPKKIASGKFALQGDWLISNEYAKPTSGAELHFNYDAKNVFLVMNPVNQTATVEVYLDNQFVKTIEVFSDSLYTIIELEKPGSHLLKLVFDNGDVEVYAFTFG